MGQLVDGVWTDDALIKKTADGSFHRPDSTLRNWGTPDGRPGPTGGGGLKAEAGRYSNLFAYTRELYQWPGVWERSTFNTSGITTMVATCRLTRHVSCQKDLPSTGPGRINGVRQV